ncbi:MAG: hypothetical protein U5K69_21565 [Balneolaceae bacterium]|nr:hypothetical protein [Balneolaceae bacterium]
MAANGVRGSGGKSGNGRRLFQSKKLEKSLRQNNIFDTPVAHFLIRFFAIKKMNTT